MDDYSTLLNNLEGGLGISVHWAFYAGVLCLMAIGLLILGGISGRLGRIVKVAGEVRADIATARSNEQINQNIVTSLRDVEDLIYENAGELRAARKEMAALRDTMHLLPTKGMSAPQGPRPAPQAPKTAPRVSGPPKSAAPRTPEPSPTAKPVHREPPKAAAPRTQPVSHPSPPPLPEEILTEEILAVPTETPPSQPSKPRPSRPEKKLSPALHPSVPKDIPPEPPLKREADKPSAAAPLRKAQPATRAKAEAAASKPEKSKDIPPRETRFISALSTTRRQPPPPPSKSVRKTLAEVANQRRMEKDHRPRA